MPDKRPKPPNNNAKSIERWDDEGGAPSGGRVTGKHPKRPRDPAQLAKPENGVKSRAEWYREKAAECDRLSLQAREPAVQKALADIALQWWDLARQVAQLDRENGPPHSN